MSGCFKLWDHVGGLCGKTIFYTLKLPKQVATEEIELSQNIQNISEGVLSEIFSVKMIREFLLALNTNK